MKQTKTRRKAGLFRRKTFISKINVRLKIYTFPEISAKSIAWKNVVYMQQSKAGKKTIIIDRRAEREIHSFPKKVRQKLVTAFRIIQKDGFLNEPDGKKISAHLFEVRIYESRQFRALYAYLKHPEIIILSAFEKKTQKTPRKEIDTANQRLRKYI